MISLIVLFGLKARVNVFEEFCIGVREGLKTVLSIFPSLFALFVAISVLRASGLSDALSKLALPLTKLIHFPSELVPFAILRPVSGSGSLAMASDIFQSYGPDSFVGRAVSVMMGSTETTFYTIAVYFGAVGIKNIRHTLKCALIADVISMALSVIVCRFYY